MGAITPIGNSVEEFWNGIKEGKTGFGSITYFDTADYRCKLAAEVILHNIWTKNLPAEWSSSVSSQ